MSASSKEHLHVNPELRRQRAAERAALVSRWAQRHHPAELQVPFTVEAAAEQTTCDICGRPIRAGSRCVAGDAARFCVTCGRRAVLDWSDRRRLEAVAARRLAENLGRATHAA